MSNAWRMDSKIEHIVIS